jgi:predicted glycosyltransferase
MKVLALRSYASGYRGCLIDEEFYSFFQITRKTGRSRRLKQYPLTDFIDPDHFMAMMLKFMTPTVFLRPPVPISALTIEELDRISAVIHKRRSDSGSRGSFKAV